MLLQFSDACEQSCSAIRLSEREDSALATNDRMSDSGRPICSQEIICNGKADDEEEKECGANVHGLWIEVDATIVCLYEA